MRIFLDLDSRLILSTPNRPIRTLEFKRRDNDSLELQFVRNGAVVSVPSATTVQYGLKPVDQYASGFFSTGSFTKTGSGEAAVFTTAFTLNTQPIAQAFALEPKSILAMLEVELREGDTVASSVTLGVTIANDVIRGDEATPAAIPDGKASQAEAQAGTDNAKWMTPLRTKQAITQAAGSYAPATGILPSAISGLQTALDGKQPSGSYVVAPNLVGAPTNVARAALELRQRQEVSTGENLYGENADDVALQMDWYRGSQPWYVAEPDNFRTAIGAASSQALTGAVESFNDALDGKQPVGNYAPETDPAFLGTLTVNTGATADLFVGSNGMVGIGTETCTEKLTVNGSIALSGGQIKNLGTPVDANDAVRKADLDSKFPTPPAAGTYALKSVNGVVSWVEE